MIHVDLERKVSEGSSGTMDKTDKYLFQPGNVTREAADAEAITESLKLHCRGFTCVAAGVLPPGRVLPHHSANRKINFAEEKAQPDGINKKNKQNKPIWEKRVSDCSRKRTLTDANTSLYTPSPSPSPFTAESFLWAILLTQLHVLSRAAAGTKMYGFRGRMALGNVLPLSCLSQRRSHWNMRELKAVQSC